MLLRSSDCFNFYFVDGTIMKTKTDGEFIEIDTSLDEAIHQLITGSHQQLLVIADKEIVGVLRSTDLTRMISQAIKVCRKPAIIA